MKIILDIVCFLFGVVAGVMSVVSGNIVAASFFIATNIIWIFITFLDIRNYRNSNFINYKDETLKDKIKRFLSL